MIQQDKKHQIIESFEKRVREKRPISIKIADILTTSFGTIVFFVFNVILFTFWILANLGKIPAVSIFDPYPFILLTTAVSLEAIFLSIIVLISQNRQSQINTLREELDLQVNLISEKEITKLLKLVKLMLEKSGNKIEDPELEEMLKEADTSYIERKLADQLTPKNKPVFTTKK